MLFVTVTFGGRSSGPRRTVVHEIIEFIGAFSFLLIRFGGSRFYLQRGGTCAGGSFDGRGGDWNGGLSGGGHSDRSRNANCR